MGKLKNLREIKKICVRLRKKRKRVVFTNGCFDILHYGHVKYLQKCKNLGDALVVGLNSDSSVRIIKGGARPVTPERERAAILCALGCVDFVVVFREKTPLRLIKAMAPRVLAKGGDWQKSRIIGSDFVEKTGGKVVSVPFVRGYSTTGIIKTIAEKKSQPMQALLRIIDANLNRSLEGLRVCEDIARFALNDKGSFGSFKTLRHELVSIRKRLAAKKNALSLLKSRSVKMDCGKKTSRGEKARKNMCDVFLANSQRAKESLRVLEEISKLVDGDISQRFKKIRFRVYELEKKCRVKLESLLHNR